MAFSFSLRLSLSFPTTRPESGLWLKRHLEFLTRQREKRTKLQQYNHCLLKTFTVFNWETKMFFFLAVSSFLISFICWLSGVRKEKQKKSNKTVDMCKVRVALPSCPNNCLFLTNGPVAKQGAGLSVMPKIIYSTSEYEVN